MKRFISFLLVAILIVTSLSVVASAAAPGETVQIAVEVTGNFANYLISLEADEGLTIQSISDTHVINSATTAKTNWANAANTTSHIVYVTVKIANDIAPGTYWVSGYAERASKVVPMDEDSDGIEDGLMATSVTVNPGCVVIEEPECEHNYELIDSKEGTCIEEGYKTYKCSKCGDEYTEKFSGDHQIKTIWSFNKTHHWHECELCGEEFDEAEHNMLQETIKPATKEEDGLKRHFCEFCDYEYEEILPKDLDEVPGTGDITPVIVLSTIALVAMMGASLFVFKRKAAK